MILNISILRLGIPAEYLIDVLDLLTALHKDQNLLLPVVLQEGPEDVHLWKKKK
jgi:hypothetical protein